MAGDAHILYVPNNYARGLMGHLVDPYETSASHDAIPIDEMDDGGRSDRPDR